MPFPLPATPARRRHALAGVLAFALLAGAACGDEDGDATSTAATTETSATPKAVAAPGTYTPVSDVTSHAAIGVDIAGIKEHLAVAKEGKPVDWAAVDTLFTKGGASKKGDGSLRTLATLLDAPDDIAFIQAAIAGGDGDAVRAQRVEKGITVLLARKVVQELDAAGEKVAAGNTDDATGAPHNVDEAWAFYLADGNGPSSTAQKRAADFKLEGVDEAVISALASAQAASRAGDKTALEAAAGEVAGGLNYIFYLASYKYLDTQNDPVRRAEGTAFYRGIAPALEAAAPDHHAGIETAFESGDVASGRTALNSAAVLSVLGLEDSQVIRT